MEGPSVLAGKVVGRRASFKMKTEQGRIAFCHPGEKGLDSHMKAKVTSFAGFWRWTLALEVEVLLLSFPSPGEEKGPLP